MEDNRRLFLRHSVYPTDFITLSINDDFFALATVSNVGQGGLLLELFPTGPTTRPARGDRVEVVSCPGEFAPLAKGTTGTLTWIEDDRCGVTYDTPQGEEDDALRRRIDEQDFIAWADSAA